MRTTVREANLRVPPRSRTCLFHSSVPNYDFPVMIEFPCQVCQTPLKANDAQAGQLVRCPTCSTTLRVPVPEGAGEVSAAGGQVVVVGHHPYLVTSVRLT